MFFWVQPPEKWAEPRKPQNGEIKKYQHPVAKPGILLAAVLKQVESPSCVPRSIQDPSPDPAGGGGDSCFVSFCGPQRAVFGTWMYTSKS